MNNEGKKLLTSELTLEDKNEVIDVAKPDPDKPPPDDMDFKNEDSEMVLKDLLIVAHEGESAGLREIMMTQEIEKFIEYGHTKVKLIDGIMQAYKSIYMSKKKAAIVLAANMETVDHLINTSCFWDRKDGDAMLLVLIFYMGIDESGSKVV